MLPHSRTPGTEAPWPWIGIAGPTASGKTALALAVAARWPVEIVSVDSALVYRGMDVGHGQAQPPQNSRRPRTT